MQRTQVPLLQFPLRQGERDNETVYSHFYIRQGQREGRLTGEGAEKRSTRPVLLFFFSSPLRLGISPPL